MTNLTKLKLGGIVALALLVGGLGVAKASGSWDWSRIEALVADKLAAKVDAPIQLDSEPSLGAVSGPALPNPNLQADEYTYIASGSFADATTTIVSVATPFRQTTSTGGVLLEYTGGVGWTGATTTVDLVRLYQTGANTSSMSWFCGASKGPTGTGNMDLDRIIVTTSVAAQGIATSSLGVMENNMTALQGNRLNAGTIAKIAIGPSHPYLVCFVELNADGLTSMTNADNTFAGKYVIRFKRLRF